MKIAISSNGEGMESQVDSQFGRCSHFVIVEVEDKEIKNDRTIKNSAASQDRGAGTSAAQIIGDEKVNIVITANVGPRALDIFKQLDIEVYQAQGVIKEVVDQFIQGKLKKVDL